MIAQFLQQQMDYILFFYGFSFILLSATCLTIRQETWRRLPWIWLALFGLVHGINDWLDLLAFDFGDSTSFTAIRLGLMTLSFIFLFEFGRVGLYKLNGKVPGRWIYIPLIACTLLGGFKDLSGLNAAARYAFGLTGGFLTAVVLFLFSKSRKMPILSLAAVLMTAYALAAGLVVPESSFFPASIINQTTFFAFTGLPIQLISGILVFIMAATVWRFYELTRVEVLPDSRRHKKNYFGLQLILILLLTLLAGWIFTKLIGDQADQTEHKDILDQAKIAAAALNSERVKNLTGSITDLQLPDYVRLRQQLVDMNQSDPYLRWLYLMFLKDGKIIFAVGSVPKGIINATPGLLYQKPPAELAEVFRTGNATTAGPYTDEYGSFISGFAPVRDQSSGAILGVLGLDFNADAIQASVLQIRLLSISVTLLFCLLVTGFYVFRQVAAESGQRITASEEKFRLLFDAAADPILLLDDTSHIIDCNAAAVQILGVTSKNQVLNQHIGRFSPERQPDGQLSSDKEDLMLQMALEDSSKHFEWTNHRLDGIEFIVSVSLTFLIMEGKKVTLVNWRDITENTRLYLEVQREKNYFEALISHNPAATVVIDSDNKVLSWNPAAEKLFGYSRAEAIGRIVDELVASQAMQAEANAYSEQALKGELINIITKRSRRNGTLVDVELSAVPVNIEGQQVGTIAIYHDITDLRKAREEAEAANQAKSDFLANMSHEIRTPLNAIIGMTSLLLDTKLDTEQGNFVETVRTSSDVLLDLINDILDFSKIEAHKLELENQLFNLRQVVEEALDLLAPKTAAKKIELAYMIDEALPVFYIGDPTRLRQILVNLLGNAAKFTDKGEVVVSVSGQIRGKQQYHLHFSVRDTGLGIPPDRADRLFQSFSQVDSYTTRRFGGTGLGLAISKRLCEMMGGTIWVESTGKPGEGSTFHFTILVQAAPEQEQFQVEPDKVNLVGKKVLVVDDNQTNRQIINHQIASWGMIATAVASGPEALSLLHQGVRFDLVLMDMQMPEMDGLTLAAEIRKEFTEQKLPLVLIPSLGYRETHPEHAFYAAYLTKPIKPSLLYNSLATAIMQRPIIEHKVTQKMQFDHGLGQRHPLRLLVAEDNVVNQKVILSLLERLGYRADIASNGLEALDALRRQPYDVILMDGQMPEMDGEETTIAIRREWPIGRQPHIIAITANALQGDRDRYFYIGMDDYISKPIRIEELTRALSRSEPLSDQENRPGSEQTFKKQIEPPVYETTPASIAAEVNIQSLAQASIDFSYLREFQSMMGEDAVQVVKDLVNLYLNNSDTLINEMRQGIASQNTDLLRRAAHTLKGNSSQVGALKLAALSDELEIVAKAGSVEGAESMLEKINLEFNNVKIDLEAKFTT